MVELGDEVLKNLRVHVAHFVFFLSIFAYLRDPCAAGLDIILSNCCHVLRSELLQVIIVEDQAVGPCPLILAVMVVDVLETVEDIVDGVKAAVFDVTDDTLLLAVGEQESGEIVPVA